MKFVEILTKKWMILLVAFLMLAGGIFAVFTFLSGNEKEAVSENDNEKENEKENNASDEEESPKERIRLDLRALLEDKTGVNTESGFKLTFPKGIKLDAGIIEEGLKVTPAIDFDLENASDGLIIKPKSYLQANKVYSFNLHLPEQNIKESWAFQTRREFKIISTLPGNKATNVPLDTGIEITFSHTNLQDVEKNFTIEPKVEGRFEMHKNIAVFIPKALKADTIYTVKIGKGVSQADSKESLKEEYAFCFQTQMKTKPQADNKPYLSVYDGLYNFPSDFQPVLEVGTSRNFGDRPLDVTLYQYDSADRFIQDFDASNDSPSWASVDRMRYMPDVSDMTPLRTYTQPLAYSDQSYYMGYLMLPENLPEGHYLIILQSSELKDYAFIQINDMQLYLSTGLNKSLVWVNDMMTGLPISDAVFEGHGIPPATTSSDGVAQISGDLFKATEEKQKCFKVLREGHPALVVPVYSGSYWYRGAEDTDYKSDWSLLYLDRSTYQPTDTIHAWGFLKPRSGGKSLKTVTVNLVQSIYDYKTYQSSKQILFSEEAALTPRGSFSARFNIQNLPSSSYTIEVVSGDSVVSSNYFFVNKYIKSQYVATIEPEYKAYFTGETFKARVGCEFFEGTPVSGYEMDYFIRRYYDYNTLTNGNMTIDSQGKADITYKIAEHISPVSWRPMGHSLNVSNKNPEETSVFVSEHFDIYPRDVMIVSENDLDQGTANITFKTNLIDLAKARETGNAYNDEGEPLYKGAAIDRNVKVTLYERYWDKRENGEYYDMISKKSIKTYEYFEVKNVLGTYQVQTVNGVADLSLMIPDYNTRKLYTIDYETVDTQNRPIKEEAYLTNYEDYWYGYGAYEDFYRLDFEDTEAKYKIGEPVKFTLKKNNNDPVPPGNILYMVLKEGIVDFWTSQSAEQSITFTEDFMPNVYLQAVYFDGRLLHTAYERLIKFDYSDRELDLTLETDKESYKPGDTVNATLKVTDKTGKPVEADVNLSVVDEAYFALFQQTVHTLDSLYRSVYDPGIINTYISYRSNIHGPGGAEGGEGDDAGGGNVRRNFVDNAFFDSLETDSRGQAKLSFTLPDNLTSWRLTYQAITDGLYAGNGQTNITTRLPFFVKASVNDTYMAGDRPVLLIKGYGEGVKPDDDISFTVTLKDAKGEAQKLEGRGKADEYLEIALPALNEGVYTITIQGSSGNLSDAIEKTFQVRKSLLIAKQVDYHTLNKDLKLDSIDGYAVLSFYNADLNDYYKALTDLYWNWGNRLDQVVARNVSRELLKQHFPGSYPSYGEKADIRSYQKEDGGFALFPYGSSDVELSAKMAALYHENVDLYRLSAYFRGIADDPSTTPLQVSAAYFGLAALREPVLLELQSFMESDVMTIDEKLYQANALAVLGDMGNAEKIYNEISKAYGKAMEPYRYIDNNGDKDDILRWTSLMAMLAVQVDSMDKMAYFGYLEHNSPDEMLINMERLILVKQGIPYISRNSSFEMKLDGKKQTVSLKDTEQKILMLSPEQLKTLEFSAIKGKVALSVSYEASTNPAQTENPVASIKRTYSCKGSPVSSIDRTDVVTVNLEVTFSEAAPEGYYEITDVLPAGLRYIHPYQSEVDQWYFGEPDGQRVKLGMYYDGKKRVKSIAYNTRVSAPGNYTADYAMVKHWESDSCGYSQRAGLQIK